MKEEMYYYSNPYVTKSSEFRVSKEDYTFNNEVGGPSLYLYNEDNLLYEKKFIRSDSLTTVTFFEYDYNRRLTISYRNYSDGGKMLFKYEYDENGNLIKRTAFKNDEEIGFEKYFYNEKNQLIKAELNNFDTWLSGEITYEHDKNGLLKSGIFKGSKDFDADLEFGHNEDGLLNMIKWKFSFGKFQLYNFEYEKIE